MLVVTRAELRKTLFVVFLILGSLAAYALLTPEETRDFSRVQKEFRVLALRDGKPFGTTLATLPKGATYLLPGNRYELAPDVHEVLVLEKTAAWQLVEYKFDNTVSTVSRYRAFRDRIEPVSHRMTFHPGLPLVFVLVIVPAAALLAFLGSLLWKAPPPPASLAPAAAPQRNAWTEIVAIVRGGMRAIWWARSVMQSRATAPVAVPVAPQPDESPAVPAEPRRSRLWTRVAAGAAVVLVVGFTAVVMFPAYCDYTPAAKVSEVILGLSAARTEISDFYDRHGRLPKDATEGNLASTLIPISRYVREMRYEEGVLTAVMTNIEPVHEGKPLTMRVQASGKGLEWTCVVRGVPAQHVPQRCRPAEVADTTGPLIRMASCGGGPRWSASR